MKPNRELAADPRAVFVAEGDALHADAALVQSLRRRESRALATLFDRYAEHVYRVLLRTLGSDAEIGDLVHDVFLRAWDGVGRLKEPEKLRGWLGSIAVFTARETIRERRRRRNVANELFPPPPVGAATGAGAALRSTYAILDRLSADESLVFALRFIDGMKLEEVAEACGMSLATVKRRLRTAQERFVALAQQDPALAEWLDQGTRWNSED